MSKRTISLPLVVLIAVVALVVGSFGTATAAGITAKQVKKIAAKVVDKKAGSLSVARAKTADSADAIKDGAITSASIKDGSVAAADLASGAVPTVMWARVGAVAGTLQKGSHAVSVAKTGTGNYDITFDRSAVDCAYSVTPTLSTYGDAFISGQTGAHVFVGMKDATGTNPADFDFSLIVTC
jgi:cell division protein YceG involved in septum cleavage